MQIEGWEKKPLSHLLDKIIDYRGQSVPKSNQGIPLINANYIDRGIALYDTTGSPASTVNPNRVILTVPTNHKIMIDGSGFEMIEPWYERKDDMVYSPASAMVDYVYGYGELNVIAGF